MTTTKEGGGGGRGEREREREGEESRTFLLESSKLMRKAAKREGRGGDGVNDVQCSPPSLEERGSERRETGLGCSKSRKSPRKMNLLISLVVVHEKSFYRREEQKKTKKRRRNFLHKQTKEEPPKKETTETRN